jgi:hypothetical protein
MNLRKLSVKDFEMYKGEIEETYVTSESLSKYQAESIVEKNN